jgi:hypothetical protein
MTSFSNYNYSSDFKSKIRNIWIAAKEGNKKELTKYIEKEKIDINSLG